MDALAQSTLERSALERALERGTLERALERGALERALERGALGRALQRALERLMQLRVILVLLTIAAAVPGFSAPGPEWQWLIQLNRHHQRNQA